MADRTVSYRFTGDFKGLTAGLTAAGKSVGDLGDKLTGLDKNGAKMRAGLTTIGDTAGKMGLAAGAGFGAAVFAAANFDQAMANVRAATGETAANMDLLREAALQAGADTAFSASEAAAGIENLAKAGVSTRDILAGGLAGALDLAAAGGIDVATASEAAATAMTQFGLAGSDVPHVADLLSAAAGKAVGEVGDFSAALSQSGLVADQVGLSIEETTGGLAAFASAGLLGSDAGTSFKATLAALTPNSKEAATLMEELGINAFDASGQFIGLSEFAGVLRTSLADMTDQQRQATLETIFGSDAVRAASILYEQGEGGIRQWITAVDDQGFAAEQAATRMDTLRGDLEQLGGALETALIGSGSGAQGPLRELVQGATDAVNVFNDLPPAAQSTTTALLGITAVTGGGLWFGSKVINGVASTKQALGDLGIEAGKAKGALAGIGKGIQFVAILEGINLLDAAFDNLFDTRFDESSLSRNLEALTRGEVVENLGKIGEYVRVLNDDLLGASEKALGWLPGDHVVSTAREELEKIDAALASMVESGNAEQAAAVFGQIEQQATELGVSTDDVAASFDAYQLALRNASGESGNLISEVFGIITAERGAASAVQSSTSAIESQSDAIRDSVEAMREKRRATLAAFEAETQWRQALVDAREQAKNNSAGIRGNSEAALANRSALSQLAAAWNSQSNAVKNNEQRFREARSTFIDTAVAMGVPEQAARDLAKSVLGIPRARHIEVTADTASAKDRLYELNRIKLDDKTLTVHVQRTGAGLDFVSGGASGFAAGGPVLTLAPSSIPAPLTKENHR